MEKNKPNWQLEHLIKSSLLRTKERFLSYFLMMVINLGISIAVLLALLIVGAIFFLIYSLIKITFLGFILGAIFIAILLIVWLYVVSWMQLALTQIIIQDSRKGAIETLKETRPLALGYLKFSLLMALFMIGLAPFGILSFGIIFILWSFWGIFVSFVYLNQRKRGLENLWVSKQMVEPKFWGISWRLLLINLAILFIQILFVSYKNGSLGFAATLISFLAGPFVIAYTYEIYKNLLVPETVKKPKKWIVVSIIGWVLLVVLIFLFSFKLINFPIPAFKIPSPSNFPTI